MKNNEMIKYKESFIYKIKSFFKKIFGRQKYSNIQEELVNKEEKKNSFIDTLKVDEKLVDAVVERKKFLKEIEGNEKALNMLSMDRLKKLEEYYDNIIEQNNAKIKKLKDVA